MRSRYLVALVVLILGFGLIGLAAWRMQWQASEGLVRHMNNSRRISIRTNRFDNRVEMLTRDGWVPFQIAPDPTPAPNDAYMDDPYSAISSPSSAATAEP